MAQLTTQQAFDLALQHHQAGRLPEAERLYREILVRQPKHAGALHYLGVMAHHLGRVDVAVALIGRAIALQPDSPEAHNNLGNALQDTGQLDEAIAAYRQALALKPDYPKAFNNLGNALQAKGRLDEALAAFRQAIKLKPDYPEAHSNLGVTLQATGRLDEAIAALRQAIALRPNYPEAHNNLGVALQAKGNLDQAIAAFGQAVALRPNLPEAHYNMGNALKDNGDLDRAIAAYRQVLMLKPDSPAADDNLIYTCHFHPAYDAQALAREHRRWNQQHAEPLKRLIQPHRNDRDAERRLRVGYVSPYLRDHVIGRNLVPLLANHDKSRFEVFAFSDAPASQEDALTQQLRSYADQWRSIARFTDEQVADQIRKDRIDVLVDLTLHMANNRLLVFARKPAPVQVTFAGYPGSTGLSAIDYRLSDPHLDPPGIDESIYSEQTIRLSDSFWCYDPLDSRETAINSLPALASGTVTFGCLNNFCKISNAVLSLWARVLREVKDSRLLLLAPEGEPQRRTLARLGQEGIDPARVEFAPRQSRQGYLELYHRIDLGLDSFPYNGHTTSLDSFWMGVPVVSLVGQAPVARAGWSQLSNLGLGEMAADSPERFVRTAVDLAHDLPRLQELRRTLRPRMEASPLMDAPNFARSIEAAYRQMWRTWAAGTS